MILCYCIAKIQKKAKSNNRFLQYCSLRGFGPVFWIYRLDGPSVWTWLTGHGGIFCCGRVFSWKWHHHTWCISERYSRLIVDQLHVVDVFNIFKIDLFVYYDSFSSLKVREILCQFDFVVNYLCQCYTCNRRNFWEILCHVDQSAKTGRLHLYTRISDSYCESFKIRRANFYGFLKFYRFVGT